MYLGIDLGTSAVKAVLVDDANAVVGQASASLEVSRPHPLWSEQDPEAWWTAANAAVAELRETCAKDWDRVKSVGLSGQMHGATLLDAKDAVLRPCILWNDGRSAAECARIEAAVPNSREITGNLAMPGFTAPKVLWVREHEPDSFKQIAKVLLPKDYLRLRMTGEYAGEMSDSAGTLWLDVAARAWSPAMLEATGLDTSHMPKLFEGSEATGTLRKEVAEAWGLGEIPVAGGGGDNAAGAAGVGVIKPGDAFLSLGTSGVLFVSNESYLPNPEGGVHTFCHCIPDTWHQMAVILSAASCLSWVTALTGATSEAVLLEEVEARYGADPKTADVEFLPYLSGERTPHNNPNAKGVFFGLTHETDRAALGQAVLEGVAFAFADGLQSLRDAGTEMGGISVIGGGARSRYWGRILASALELPMTYRSGGEVGPAYGAARLARLAVTGENPAEVCTAPPVAEVVEPDATLTGHYRARLERYRALYRNLRELY